MSVQFEFTTTATADWDTVPAGMKDHDNWMVVDSESKAPISGHDPTDVSKLLSFEEASRKCGSGQGLGFQFSETPYFGIDWDDVAENKECLAEGFRDALREQFDTYTEWSSSGTGLHQIGRGELDEDYGNRRDISRPEGAHVEVYDEKRYFVITGDRLADFEHSIAPLAQEVWTWHRDNFNTSGGGEVESLDKETDVTAEQVKATLEAWADSDNSLSTKAQATLDLWESTPVRGQGYGDGGSERDASFCAHLWWWCKHDTGLVDECWRKSQRFDEKAHRTDYREQTIGFVKDDDKPQFTGRYCR